MRRLLMALFFALAMTSATLPANGQQTEAAARLRTKEQLAQLLDKLGPSIKIAFRQNEKQSFSFVGVLKEGLTEAELVNWLVAVDHGLPIDAPGTRNQIEAAVTAVRAEVE